MPLETFSNLESLATVRTKLNLAIEAINALEEAPGGGTWGSIVGTLSDQTDLQTALNSKANISSLAAVALDGAYSSLIGIPSTFTPSAHTQAFSTLTGLPSTLSGYGITDAQPLDSDLTSIAALTTTSYGRGLLELANVGALKTSLSLVKGDVGLGNVDNTSDANKPISTATQTALDLKQNLNLAAWTYIQSSVPSSPTTGQRWLELSGTKPIGQWYWTGAVWADLRVETLTEQRNTDITASAANVSVSLTMPVHGNCTQILIEEVAVVFQGANPSTWDASNYYEFDIRFGSNSQSTSGSNRVNQTVWNNIGASSTGDFTPLVSKASVNAVIPVVSALTGSTISFSRCRLNINKTGSAPNLIAPSYHVLYRRVR